MYFLSILFSFFCIGNLDIRSNTSLALNETFTYDDLDRLLNISNINQSQQISYLPSGNIESKSDAGPTYNYAALPHAVASIDNPTANIPVLQQDITYTAFQKAEKITEGNYELTFTYGSDYQRRISELKNSGNTERKINYIGDYEKIEAGGNIYEVHYIASSDGLAAIAVKQNAGAEQIYYVHTDHLGSIMNIYDATGHFVYATNFDAWGRERNPNTWTYTQNPNTAPEWLIRGYTGHEHHREFGLINMNGRMYDPIVARMLSPDNFVQSADNTQTYNRLSYAGNNPLKYTDPNGQWIWLIAAAVGGAINVATHWDAINAGGKFHWDKFGEALIVGGVAGTAAFFTGGAALGATGLSAATVAGGALAGAAGSAAASPILGIGNNIFFGDPYSPEQFAKDVIIGSITGGVVGGILGRLSRPAPAPGSGNSPGGISQAVDEGTGTSNTGLQIEKMVPEEIPGQQLGTKSIPNNVNAEGISYVKSTVGNSIPNTNVGMSAGDMTNELTKAGGKFVPLQNGNYAVDLNDAHYVFYNRSSGGVGVQIFRNGIPIQKYSLIGW